MDRNVAPIRAFPNPATNELRPPNRSPPPSHPPSTTAPCCARRRRQTGQHQHQADRSRLPAAHVAATTPASISTSSDPTSHGSLLRRSPPPPRPGPTPLDAPARLIPEPDPNPSPTENQPNLPIHRSDLRTRKPPRCVRLQPPTARQHHPAPSARPPGCGARASLRSASRRAPPGYG